MDFIRVAYKEVKDKETGLTVKEYYPALQVVNSSDLVIRGGRFQAIWDEDSGLYSRKVSDLAALVDRFVAREVAEKLRSGDTVKKLRSFDNGIYARLQAMIRSIGDMGPELDQRIVYANEVPVKSMAATFKMEYSLSDAPCPTWEELLATLYDEENRLKIEWAIGSIFAGASIHEVQKMYVFFGPPGTGKSTIMNIIEMLFKGHSKHFSAYEMGRGDSAFALEPFMHNPLVAIDQDGDLSRIETNKNLNSIVSHDRVVINSKGINLFEIKPRATLFIGTNDPVKITNRKSGLFRRLVDIQPTGNTFQEDRYRILMAQIPYELGAIANHCLGVFNRLGPTFLSEYRSNEMMYRTNDIFNFVQDHRMVLAQGITLKQAHKLYMSWCEETETRNVYKQFQFRDLLADYFLEFHEQIMIDGQRFRSYFKGLRDLEQFSWKGSVPKPMLSWLEMVATESLLDKVLAHMPAQYASDAGTPKRAWENVVTKLSEIDTSLEHFVKVPTEHIVIDIDLKDEHGNKSLEKCLEEAALWPPTYAELSRSGNGLHLHYEYDGEVSLLDPVHKDGVEVKTLLGGSSLRRRFSHGNGIPVATIGSGLKIKEERKMLSPKAMSGEKGLRELIGRALDKGIHAHTKPNMDFIAKVLQDAFDQGMVYDVSDLWDPILAFAMSSQNQRSTCLEIAMGLKLASEGDLAQETVDYPDRPIAVFDCEVYPNLFAIGWIYEDAPDEQYVQLVNPTPAQVEELFERLRLIGYNNRGYDAHIMWARTLGKSNAELYEISQRLIVENDRKALFGAAYNATYADLYDMLSEKRTLKWWQIHYGLPHKELDLPWNEPVPEDRIDDVMEYLRNDVLSTREVLRRRSGDVRARQILAKLSGLQMINTNRQHTEKLIFGDAKDVSNELQYTDLHEMFPGYQYDRFKPGKDKSTYRGEVIGEGGLVRSSPGMYQDVALYDVASMHPASIIALNLFGKYTSNFHDLVDIRLALKAKDFEKAREIKPEIAEFLTDETAAKELSDALKIVINSVYGLTAASFPNMFRDPRNIDNIVAKRGALFMMDLREFIEGEGYQVVHIKTDSVKVPNAKPQLFEAIQAIAEEYGYNFEHEATYDRFCLLNDAVYVARYGWAQDERKIGTWEAVGAQFQHPVVFKALFTGEEILWEDYVETKQVQKGHMYLEHDEGARTFIGRFGAFVPVVSGGQTLLRVDGDKASAVTGTKDFKWALSDVARIEGLEVDQTYYQDLINEGISAIEKFGDFAAFTGK